MVVTVSQSSSSPRTASLLAILAALLVSAGCAASRPARPVGTTAPPPQAGESASPEDLLRDALDAQVESAIESSRAEYRAGVAALRAGRHEEARRHLDRSVEILLDAPVPVSSDPRLTEALNEIVESVHALELEAGAYDEGEPEIDEEPSPLEELDEIDPTIDEETAARELAIIEQAQVEYDYPVVVNDRVLAWIDIYTGPMRDRFEAGLKRSGWYLDMIHRIFEEEGIPRDLAYMAHVESSYKPHAYSRARAKGVWQFIASTGRRYGLKRDWWVDERSDPEMATRAAANYLKDLYAMFGDWQLAMAAYNAGEGKVGRALRQSGGRTFWDISRGSYLRLETRNYVPAIMAATIISRSPARFGFTLERHPPVVYDTVVLDHSLDLAVAARCAGTTVEELKRLNPALYRTQTPPGYELRLPPGSAQAFEIVLAGLPAPERVPTVTHTVRSGDTLTGVARRYGVSSARLAAANGLSRNAHLQTGGRLTIPKGMAPVTGLHPDSPGTPSASVARKGSGGGRFVYRVRRGDTLYSIARRYGTSVQALRQANGLGRSNVIVAGRKLVIPAAGSSSARASSGGAGGSGAEGRSRVTHRVRRGDTLSRIARAYGSTIDDLCRWNNISRTTTLMIGSTLVLYR